MKQALAQALQDRGYTTLTPVQEAVTKPELAGADLLVSAQTGSGKTLGFGLAIAPVLLGEDEAFGPAGLPLALIIAPTRELAMQVKRELGWLYAKAWAVMASCVGGMDMRDERRALDRGAHIVVATPGRLRDHIMRGSIDLGEVRAIVLDEADEMLDLGFREDLEFILGEAPGGRQTLMFSATVPASIARLAQSYQKDAVRVVTRSEHSQHADIEYRAMTVSERDAENAVINTLRFYEAPNAIVFCNTRAVVNRLTTRLSNRGFQVVALSGELSQAERTHALQAMRDGRARVCVATDVAARGIDLPNLDLVVHAELPSNHETLLHRSGRTGRAGRKGVSALVVTPKTRKKAERILKGAQLRAEWTDAPSSDAVQARDEERMLDDPAWLEPLPDSESAIVGRLTATFSAAQLAAAYLRLYRDQHTAPEDLSEVDARPAPRAAFGPSVWFAVPGGRAQNAEPRRLLPMLCKAGNITRDDIGAIRIEDSRSLVEIREASVADFLAAIGPGMTVENGVALARVDTPPVPVQTERPSAPPRRKDRPAEPLSRNEPKPRSWERKGATDTATAPQVGPPPAEKHKPARPDKAARKERRADAPPKADTRPGTRDAGRKASKPEFAGDPSVSLRRKRGADAKSGPAPRSAGKGPPPPPGKPGSKKNRARAEAQGRPFGKPGGRPNRGPKGGKR